jgi:peroxiredoxin
VTEAYGCKGLILSKRTVYVVGKDGKIAYAKRGKPSVKEILDNVPVDAGK